MQNYINMTCIDCFIISGNTEKKEIDRYSRSLRSEGDKLLNTEYTKVELIYTLANAIKHRNELEFQCEKILCSSNPEEELFARIDSYRKETLQILNEFNLLTPLNSNYCEWEIYPVVKGMSILDAKWNLQKISKELFKWGKSVIMKSNEEGWLKQN